MQKNSRILVTVVAAAAFLAVLAGVTTAQRLAPAPAAVAVVDVAKVYMALAERNEMEADYEKMRRDISEEDEDRREKIAERQEDLKLTQAGSDAYGQKRNELEMAALTLQAWQEFKKRELSREQTIQKEKLYKTILAAIGDFAEANEYDLVLYKEAKVNFSNIDPKQVDTLIALRKTLWAREGMDITDPLIAKMNNDFTNAVE